MYHIMDGLQEAISTQVNFSVSKWKVALCILGNTNLGKLMVLLPFEWRASNQRHRVCSFHGGPLNTISIYRIPQNQCGGPASIPLSPCSGNSAVDLTEFIAQAFLLALSNALHRPYTPVMLLSVIWLHSLELTSQYDRCIIFIAAMHRTHRHLQL